MYPRTPIKIENDQVLAWIWNGHETRPSTVDPRNNIPVYRLGRPTKGMWRNGRLLRIPHRSDYVQDLAQRSV